MSQDNLNTLWDDHVAAVLEEQGFSIQEDPRSVYKVEKLFEALAKYAPENAPRIDSHNVYVRKGIALARACFARPEDALQLECLEFSPRMIWDITSNHNGSPGLTNYGKKKAESVVRAYERGRQIAQGEKSPEPCLAFKRTQFNDKTRLVWGYPYSMTALEGIFARPLIERFKEGSTPMAFAMQTGVLGSKLRVASYHKTFAYSTDVSSFDSSISGEMIGAAFDILSTWFNLDTINEGLGVPNRNVWNLVEKYFITTPIVMPDGKIYKGKKHGVPSGSYFTQIVDSIINTIIVGAIDAKFHLGIDKQDIFVLGDDVLFWSNRKISLEEIANFGSTLFNCKMNAEKSARFRYDEVIHYLGRDWDHGVPSLNVDEILKRMTQPETYRKYDADLEEQRRQVRLLLLSYAATYYNAYPVYARAVYGRSRPWMVTNASLETQAIARKGCSYHDADPIDPDRLSGLQRYLMKYVTGRGRKGS